jgi:transposase
MPNKLNNKQKREKVISYREAGLNKQSIARRLNVSLTFVKKWLKRYKETKSLDEVARPGRPSKISPKDQKKIKRLVKGKRFASTRKISKSIQSNYDIHVSHCTIWRLNKKMGLVPIRRKPQPKLTKKHISARLQFAIDYAKHNWLRTLITDEKHFYLHQPINKKIDVIWDLPGTEHTYETVKYSKSVRVWGGISWYGKTPLIVYEHNLDQYGYQDVLREAKRGIKQLFERENGKIWWFQQDGCTSHSAKSTIEFIRKQFPKARLINNWPANSPDLSPIENMWADLQNIVAARNPTTVEELTRFVKEEWENYPMEKVKNLINSISNRLKETIQLKGGFTKH